MNSQKVRNPALDIIRSIALFCVIGVHFFAQTNFYDHTITGTHMLLMCIMRNSFMICVPLFLMLTGYLSQSKELSKSYCFKIVRILYVYFIASLLCGFYGVYVLKAYSLPRAFLRIISFETAPYSWYIELYIGFFLLIPFLNHMYDGLSTQRSKQKLLITSLLLTALPSITNIYNHASFQDPEWWLMPGKSPADYLCLVSERWTEMYPFTYFFLGKYIKDYPIKCSPKQIASVGIFVFLFAGIYNFYRSYGSIFIYGPWQDYSSFLITLQAVLLFCFFAKINYKNLPSTVKKVFCKISTLSLGAYLTSWMFDSIVYTKLNASIQTMPQKLMYFPITVILVLIGSLMCSYAIDVSYTFIGKVIRKYTKHAVRN